MQLLLLLHVEVLWMRMHFECGHKPRWHEQSVRSQAHHTNWLLLF
jgi:hypothetical protein